MARSLSIIANEILSDFQREYREARVKHLETGKGKLPKQPEQKYVHAMAYVRPMLSLDSIDDNYMMDSGRSVVAYALGNLTTWKGEKAREIKKELNAMLK